MVETFTNSRAEEVRSLRLDVFYPHLNLIPETSHLSILVISRNSSEGRISSNRGSPRISHHLFKTLFRFPLKRSKKKEKIQSASHNIPTCVVDHAARMEMAVLSIRGVAMHSLIDVSAASIGRDLYGA